MQLKVFIPSGKILDVAVEKVIAEDVKGSFCLLPKHIDCVRILVAGLLIYSEKNEEKYVGIDDGVLVKCKDEVRIGTKKAIENVELGAMKNKIEEKVVKVQEYEKKVRNILTELEIDFIKRYTELKKL